ncbi:type I-B CRISPR-associated protein Cas7/Csh2 [Caldicellulosiruptor morganii]|uniref:Type I-B CRISPR-associated protein Cas7/Csh2 n=1 Tax=Caldicellulosiruptor morganii TaxID=1387555 RepID=A0ABY7BMU3_9FIRM|nr:type I-B CRISPR-associated protein Cas7/Csh2 [Caldicellulosiruptor morganii]WAM33899.1 type I-B CRISPR-associated protein Cas7/Csh2 [Caldicellulosiruptor morganii]
MGNLDNIIKNRSEILFIYDVTDANPNGDPLDENKPRIDPETDTCIVTDVRLKRTCRDYLAEYKNLPVFILREITQDGKLMTKAEKWEKHNLDEEKLKEFIDIRLFGGTITLKSKDKKKKGSSEEDGSENTGAITFTGPVQFKFGRSLHKVEYMLLKGTTVMPSGEGKDQGTFTECYILPYALIAFYGVINENAALCQNIPLTEEDVQLLLESLWCGTKNLISRSKFGQMPRLLLRVEYNQSSFYIGELDRLVKLISQKSDVAIRSPEDYQLDITKLVEKLKKYQDRIQKLEVAFDDSISFICEGVPLDISRAFSFLGDRLKIIQFE